ncbi:sensor histidine kinase [Halorientalis salina]|uniref:sensor histidine kinase n=1 Tax=Halorientalis salina TaxID=2932266 RepID=UPI0010AD24F9|nr:response regulator [Halorientalis salina]
MTDEIRLLMVDDSEFFAEMTASTLSEEHGMTTFWETSAEDALTFLDDTEIDCIVSDYEMPGANGLELLDMVTERHGDVPFILLTGRGDEEIASKAIAAGVSDYILKLEVVEDQQYQQLANRVESAVTQKRAQRRYELLVNNTPDAVAQVSANGEFIAANPAMADLASVSREELLGSDIVERLPDGIGDEWLSVGRTAIETGESQRSETEFDDRYFHNIFAPVDIRTERNTFQLIARDVTERVERERELERQNERLDRFASMVSHDLRNPLDVAEVNLSLLSEQFEDPPEELDRISGAHGRMTALIDDVLTLARQGATVEDPEPTDLEPTVEQVWPYIETGDAELVVEAEGTIEADGARLQELLSNLFRNAVEHGDASEIRVGRVDDGFFVADDGDGIPADERSEVFRTGYSTTDDGTGFGLAIVEEIAEAHGWSVAVADSKSGGARFDITGVTYC